MKDWNQKTTQVGGIKWFHEGGRTGIQATLWSLLSSSSWTLFRGFTNLWRKKDWVELIKLEFYIVSPSKKTSAPNKVFAWTNTVRTNVSTNCQVFQDTEVQKLDNRSLSGMNNHDHQGSSYQYVSKWQSWAMKGAYFLQQFLPLPHHMFLFR